ncbi:hypothetical protein [Sinorhizobium meliloti]|uniref:hypothetical protein n=1 Tax=Rhizobium meliloti TaxID=382 RepID=UPI001F3F0E0E|nr:hypothetical protein [Sinorhizobium meliloti]
MTAVSTRRPARVSIIVGNILLASAIVVAFDANRIQGGFTYGISPAAVPYVVAGFLGLPRDQSLHRGISIRNR